MPFSFWGLFIAFFALVVMYVVWLKWVEKND
jgi:predicted PurR-regulated permease PerM